jgi:hypothetical protein
MICKSTGFVRKRLPAALTHKRIRAVYFYIFDVFTTTLTTGINNSKYSRERVNKKGK